MDPSPTPAEPQRAETAAPFIPPKLAEVAGGGASPPGGAGVRGNATVPVRADDLDHLLQAIFAAAIRLAGVCGDGPGSDGVREAIAELDEAVRVIRLMTLRAASPAWADDLPGPPGFREQQAGPASAAVGWAGRAPGAAREALGGRDPRGWLLPGWPSERGAGLSAPRSRRG